MRNRNLISYLHCFTVAVLLTFAPCSIHSMQHINNIQKAVTEKLSNQLTFNTVDVSKTIVSADDYICIETMLFTLIDTLFSDFPALMLRTPITALELFKSTRIKNIITAMSNANEKICNQYFDLHDVEKILKDFIEQYIQLIESKISPACQLINQKLSHNSIKEHLHKHNKNIQYNSKQFIEKITALLSHATAFNITNQELLTNEIEKIAEQEEIQLGQPTEIKAACQLGQLTRICLELDKRNYSKLQKLCYSTAKKLLTSIKQSIVTECLDADNICQNVQALLQRQENYTIKPICKTELLEERLGIQRGTFQSLHDRPSTLGSYVEATKPLSALLSNKGAATIQGAVLGAGITTGVWLLSYSICHTCMQTIEELYKNTLTPLSTLYACYTAYHNLAPTQKTEKALLGLFLTGWATGQYMLPEYMSYFNGTLAAGILGYHAYKLIQSFPNRLTSLQEKVYFGSLVYDLLFGNNNEQPADQANETSEQAQNNVR